MIKVKDKYLHPYCRECRKCNVVKEDVIDPSNGKTIYKKGEFAISCSGIPADGYVNFEGKFLHENDLKSLGLDEEDIESIKEITRPSYWAKKHVKGSDGKPWTPRVATETYGSVPYQELMLDCTANRVALRCGRRSGKSVAMSMIALHFACTNSPLTRRKNANGEWVSGLSTVLVTAPYEKQIHEIFDIIRKFIKNSSDLSDITTRETLKPALLEFTNDSKIASQTTGTKTGQGGDAIRGQSPHVVLMDEADLMCDADLAAIIPLLGTSRDSRLICGSTVKHSRGVFWKLCNDPTYKEFFFPSQVSPEWTEQLDFEFRLNGTQAKYAAEVLVDFGEIGSGVYQEKYIGLALEDYEYDEEVDPNKFYTLGVDWNDEANGSTFSVIEFYPLLQLAIRKNCSKISKKDWNQTAAVQEVLRLHSIFNFDSIYVDEGHGTYQIEMLKGIGLQAAQNPGAFPRNAETLYKVIHKFNFSSSIEVLDPENQQKVKVKAKPFLIENSVRFFENLKVKISKRDIELIEQLRGFIIDHVGVSGAPIYGMRESSSPDHALMAFVLSLVAITMELSTFINQVNVETFHICADNPFVEQPSKPEKFSRIESRKLDLSRPNIMINSEDFDNDDKYQVSVGRVNRFRRPIAKRNNF